MLAVTQLLVLGSLDNFHWIYICPIGFLIEDYSVTYNGSVPLTWWFVSWMAQGVYNILTQRY